jgi:hypothetical protein
MSELNDQGPRFVAERIGEHRAVTPEGYLIALGVPIARTGIQQYRSSELNLDGPERIVNVERPAEEVFDPAAMVSFEGKTITSPHPPSFLNSQNESLFHKGHVQTIRRGPRLPDGNQAVVADLVFKDQDLIQQVESALKKEISCGYEYTLEPTEDPNYFIMRNIRGNHVAIVSSGRAGEHVKVLDANPEEEAAKDMAESAEVGLIQKTVNYLRSLGWSPPTVADASLGGTATAEEKKKDATGAVERNQQYNDLAAERAKGRNEDMKTKDNEYDKEDSKAAPPDKKEEQGEDEEKDMEEKDKKSKDAEEKEEPMRAEDARKLRKALDRMTEALERNTRATQAKDADEEEEEKEMEDEEEDEKKDDKKEEAEDADLIPVITLKPNERPKNPIPGADAIVNSLKSLKVAVAKSGDRKAIDAYNRAVSLAKRGVEDDSPYAALAERGDKSKPDVVKDAESRRRATGDSKDEDAGKTFVESTRKYLGKNPASVKEGGN